MPLRTVNLRDAGAILEIYSHYVLNTSITFETEIPSNENMTERIRNISGIYPWYIFESDGEIKGYAYASRHRERAAYRWSVDFAVYVKNGSQGNGIGGTLYSKLIDTVRNLGYYNAFGIITLPNDGSIALHESAGFTLAGINKNNGYKLGDWHDVGIWQLKLREADEKPEEPRVFKI